MPRKFNAVTTVWYIAKLKKADGQRRLQLKLNTSTEYSANYLTAYLPQAARGIWTIDAPRANIEQWVNLITYYKVCNLIKIDYWDDYHLSNSFRR